MGNRLSKIYTRTGDDGTTGLGDGKRVPKDSPRVEAYGTVDELNSAIGMLLAVPRLPRKVSDCLTEAQHELFDLGGELCIPGHRAINAAHVTRLERALDGRVRRSSRPDGARPTCPSPISPCVRRAPIASSRGAESAMPGTS